MTYSKLSSSNENPTGLGNSFFKTLVTYQLQFSVKQQILVDEQEKISQSINSWSNNLSHLPHITQSFIKEYPFDVHGSNK